MIAQPLISTYEQMVTELRSYHPKRTAHLFYEFLPKGYALTTLRPMSDLYWNLVIEAKLTLACLITFQDDLADDPIYYNRPILDVLYGHSMQRDFSPLEQSKIQFSKTILQNLMQLVKLLPLYERYADLLAFDLDQFFNANRYSSLLTKYRGIGNGFEMRMFGPFNMGMVIAATIDLMAMHIKQENSISRLREAAYLGQQAGRISNVLSTYEREQAEGDVTNELTHLLATGAFRDLQEAKRSLTYQHSLLVTRIRELASAGTEVDLIAYADGIEKLHALHMQLKGSI